MLRKKINILKLKQFKNSPLSKNKDLNFGKGFRTQGTLPYLFIAIRRITEMINRLEIQPGLLQNPNNPKNTTIPYLQGDQL